MSYDRLSQWVGHLQYYELSNCMRMTFLDSLGAISASRWNALCPSDYPFVRHEFLSALEISGSATELQGWSAQHLIVEEGNELIAAVPLYLKSHSYGEYVFDWAWADAYKRFGLSYYPKLIAAVPFTPCTGPRMLFADQQRSSELIPQILGAIKNRAQVLQASSFHCLFPKHLLSQQLVDSACIQRIGCQFHWFNRDYGNWGDFISSMTSRKRKNIIKERRNVQQQDIGFVTREGSEISAEDWLLFYKLYCNTYLKRSGHAGYLTEHFFRLLREYCSDTVVMINAVHQQTTIAAALYFKDSTTLYGRYWGCLEEYNFLHFETCYYQGIEYAIKHRLQRFDGGAQGEHKIQRGFEPVITYSNHWIARSDFQQAIADFVSQEAPAIHAYQQDAKQHLPFKDSHFVD